MDNRTQMGMISTSTVDPRLLGKKVKIKKTKKK
jgi:hypothetical protein